VLSGTLIYREQGVLVNARIINVKTEKVIATSSKLLPWFVLEAEQVSI
jgi:hypothetical protein